MPSDIRTPAMISGCTSSLALTYVYEVLLASGFAATKVGSPSFFWGHSVFSGLKHVACAPGPKYLDFVVAESMYGIHLPSARPKGVGYT